MTYDWGEVFKNSVKSYQKTSIIIHMLAIFLIAGNLFIFLVPLPLPYHAYHFLRSIQPLSIACLVASTVIIFFCYPLKKNRIEKILHEEISTFKYEHLYRIAINGNRELEEKVIKLLMAYGKIEYYQYDELSKNLKSSDIDAHLTTEEIKKRLLQEKEPKND